MHDFSARLGDAVRTARLSMKLTQSDISEAIDISSRTVLNIEKGEGNPQLQTLCVLVRLLRIDPVFIFYPERYKESPSRQELHALIDTLNDSEAADILPIVHAYLDVISRKKAIDIDENQ